MDATQANKPNLEKDFELQLQTNFNQGNKKRKFLETSEQGVLPSTDMAYDADVDDEFSESKHPLNVPTRSAYNLLDTEKIQNERTHIYEFFQPWALKTYGDQAKTKTITMRKKARILKALEGKEHSRPDSSKFRFWVKSKGFTTKRPEGFEENPASRRSTSTLPPGAILSENPSRVDLFVASRSKENGKRLFRKVAVVEEFFDIIYNVHMELGGRSGMHAGQKRTYRIITETYAFLPREAVTRFLSTCPECKKNLRPTSPGALSSNAEQPNESSSEVEVLNYSSHTESSLEAGPTLKNNNQKTTSNPPINPTTLAITNRPTSSQDNNSQKLPTSTPKRPNICIPYISHSLFKPLDTATLLANKPDVNITPSVSTGFSLEPPVAIDNNNLLKSQEHLLRYYDFVRRFYTTGMSLPDSQMPSIPSTSRYSLSKFPLPTLSNPSPHTIAKSSLRHLSDDEDVDTFSPTVKRFKSSISPSQANYENLVPRIITSTTQGSVLNLSKQLSCRSQVLASEVDAATTDPAPCADLRREIKQEPDFKEDANSKKNSLPPLDLESLKPITSTYLQLTRSMGLSDEDALRFDNLETLPATPAATVDATSSGENNSETDPYAGLMKDADKLKLMLLAWNYQNSNAVRNGTEGPDLSVVGGLWAQYQNALAQSAAATSVKIETSLSPVPRGDVSSPMEAQDETNSSGQKEEDEGSEDDSDDKLDEKLAPHDPERLKAFNMFVRLFVDENLDRIVPISKQPKEKIQAIIDSCARQFPEFSDRSRKRIRTYLKSCRRNKKTREGWDNSTRPTPAHLTSVQAEQILAIACENESMNAKRMRIGLEPITHAIPAPGSAVAAAAAAAAAAVAATSSSGSAASSTITSASANEPTNVVSTLPFSTALGFARSTPNSETADSLTLTPTSAAAVGAAGNGGSLNSARSSPITGLGNNIINNNNSSMGGLDIKPITNILTNGSGASSNNANGSITTLAGLSTNSPLYRTTDFTAAATSSAATSPFVAAAAAAAVAGRTLSGYTQYFQNAAAGLGSVTPTDLSMKPAVSSSVTAALNTLNNNMQLNNNVTSAALSNIIGSTVGLNNNMNNNNITNNNLVTATQQLQQLQQQQQHHQQQQQQQAAAAVAQLAGQTNISSSLAGAIEASLALRGPPLIPHKLSPSEIAAARSVVHAYRESASFLMRTADHIDQMLLTQQQQQQQQQHQQQPQQQQQQQQQQQ